MATATFTVTKQYMADTGTYGGGAANPGDVHIPIGKWDPGTGLGWVTRALLYAPINFSGMTGINSAYLVLRAHTAPGWHANGSGTKSLRVRRKSGDWSETSGGVSSAVDELWGGNGSYYVVYESFGAQDSDQAFSADLGDTAEVWINITQIVGSWFGGSANYGLKVEAVGESSYLDAFEFYSRHASGLQPRIVIDYSTNTAPNAPTGLSPTGSAVLHTGSTVTVSGSRSDNDSGDYITGYHIQIYNDAMDWLVYESYDYPGGSPTTFSKSIGGMPTAYGLNWRARTRDRNAEWGPLSAFQRFVLNSVPNVPTVAVVESPSNDLRTLTPSLRMTHQDPDTATPSAYGYEIHLYRDGPAGSGTIVWNSGAVSISPQATFTVPLPTLEWGKSYWAYVKTQDYYGAWSNWAGRWDWVPTLTTHLAGVPVSLAPSGVQVGGLVPTFSGARASSADSLTSAQVQVFDSTGATLIWDSGTFTGGVTSTAFSKAYAGSTLAYSTAYTWRARVTSSVGGTSNWSALQPFTTGSASAIVASDPVGSGITDLTPDFVFSRTDSFNAYQIVLTNEAGTTLWDSGAVGHASATSKTVTYPGTPALAWSTTYKWKVRVSSDGGSSWGNDYTDLVTFTTEAAGIPDLTSPAAAAWLGAPFHVETAESLDGVTGSAASTVTLDTTVFDVGAASLKAAIASLNGTQSVINKVTALDLSNYGDQTPIVTALRVSSLTNVTDVAVRFTDSLGAYAQYTVTPVGTGAFEDVTVTKGVPDAVSGTIDWSDITEIAVRVTTSASTSLDLWVDDIRLDATNPSFDGEAAAGETISTVRVIVYTSDQTTVFWDSGEVAVGATTFSVPYGGSALTPGATYYWTARYVEDLGPTGGYAALRAFSLNVPPNAPTNRTPASGGVVADTLTPEFKATFSDPDLAQHGDVPTVFEVEVYQNSDSALMHVLRATTGLVAGENAITRSTEGSPLVYETEYKWRTRFMDRFGVPGTWSSYSVVKPSESPVVAITSPVSTISSPSFNVVWTFTSSGGKVQNRFRVKITRDSDSVLIYDSGTTFSSVQSHTIPAGYLVNSTDYTITVEAHDTDGLSSGEVTGAITSAWAAPDAIQGFSVSALTETSEMLLRWDVSSLPSSDFSYYQIYRREPGDAEWTRYATVTNQQVTEYSDYYAGHSVTYEYKVTVWKKVVGDVDVESPSSEVPYAVLDPDSWFVIGADRDPSHIFELPVESETHSEPIQQEVFEPLGSRRKSIVRGKVLGAEGTVQVQWTDDERVTAQVYLRYLADMAGPHILKSPFGDVWLVEFSGPAKKYMGGGRLSVTLTWIEVI